MKIENIQPLQDFVLIQPEEQETTLPSGIIIADSAKEKPQKGKILSVGPGKSNDKGESRALSVKAGDIVYYKKWGGTELKIEGTDVLLMREDDLIAKVIGQ